MGSALVLVLALMALTTYGAKRFLGPRLGLRRSTAMMKVLATTYLDAKRQIALLEVGEEYLVLGITVNQISLLARLDRPPAFLEKNTKNQGLGA